MRGKNFDDPRLAVTLNSSLFIAFRTPNKTELRVWLFRVVDSSIYDIFIVGKFLCRMSENVYCTRLKYGEEKLISTFYIDGIVTVTRYVRYCH